MARGSRLCSALTPLAPALIAASGATLLWLRFNETPPKTGLIPPHDLIYYFYPQMEMVGARLAAFELPLWNPHGCMGLPLLAALQPAAFYPGTWLSVFLPADFVISLLSAVHLGLSSIFAALLFRAWGVERVLAGAFGVLFAYACVLGQTFWPPEVATITWMPWQLLCIERLMTQRRTRAWWLGLVFGTTLQILAGFPQLAAYSLQVVVPYAIVRGIEHGRRTGNWRAASLAGMWVAVAIVLGVGLAAIQLWPTTELLLASNRAEAFSERETQYLQFWSRHPVLLKNSVTPAARLLAVDFRQGAGYLGIGTLVLMLVALVERRREPLTWCLAGAGMLFWFLSDGYLGSARELYRLYALIPGVGYFRAPERLLIPAFASFIGLAALGAQACASSLSPSGTEESGRLSRVGLAVALLTACGIAVAGTSGAAWRAGLAAVAIILVRLIPQHKTAHSLWCVGAAALLIADVSAATGAYGSLRKLPTEMVDSITFPGGRVMPESEFARVREQAGLARIAFAGARPLNGVGGTAGAYRVGCLETLMPRSLLQLSLAASQFSNKANRSWAGIVRVPSQRKWPAFYDLAGTAYLGGRVGRKKGLRPNPGALPRAYLVDHVRVMDEDSALEHALRGDFDYRREVILDARPELDEPGRLDELLPAVINAYAPERVEISTQAATDAVLVLTDTYAAGWSVQVDGRPAQLHRANGLFRAVSVPAGRHQVVFEYTAPGLREGAVLTGISLLTAFAICWTGVVAPNREAPFAT